jgi:hypothetical protein
MVEDVLTLSLMALFGKEILAHLKIYRKSTLYSLAMDFCSCDSHLRTFSR